MPLSTHSCSQVTGFNLRRQLTSDTSSNLGPSGLDGASLASAPLHTAGEHQQQCKRLLAVLEPIARLLKAGLLTTDVTGGRGKHSDKCKQEQGRAVYGVPYDIPHPRLSS